ncbi:DEKNAAC104962 [Brettanomyces naardenensis]|uniref:DEKNAAC104962 n=1 Tax=Brettanomyces naardenensis TaxID=13370 RepID=A0A448YRV4_BRENA|nr:DEKNAAC104962 [Brettanomyces naardenensis]
MGFKGHWDCETAALKKRFHQLAKIYHPDSSAFDGACLAKKTFFNSNETESAHDGTLTNSLKAQRFKRILSAYSLLKNPLTKSNYDDYRVGWEDNSIGMHRSPNPNYHNPNSAFYRNMGRTKTAHGNTGTWEDYWDTSGATYGFTGDSSWQAEGETFSEHFQNNRKNIFISVALFLAVYAALQATHLYMFDNYIGGGYGQTYSSEEIQDRSERDLVDARVNFGLGLTKEDRINRFLWFRQISMLLSLGDINAVKEHMLGMKLLIHDQETGRVRIREYENKKLMKHRQEKQPETVGEKTVGASIEEAAEEVTKEAAEAGEATTATSS